MSSTPVPIDGDEEGATVDPSGPEVPEGTGTMSRNDAIEAVAAMLRDEGQPPKTAAVLATIYMTSDELSKMLAALDQVGGVPGVGGLVKGLLFSRRRNKGDDDG